MKKLLGVLLASLAMFGFGAAFWMTPLTTSFFMSSSDDETAGRRLKEMFPASGTYYLPSQQNPPDKHKQLHEAGPVATIHIQHEGSPVMDAKVLLAGFVHELISMALAAMIMSSLLSVLNTYVRRAVFVAMLGLLIAWFSPLSAPIWWHHPWAVHVVDAVYTALAWLVAGLVLSAFIKPVGPSAK